MYRVIDVSYEQLGPALNILDQAALEIVSSLSSASSFMLSGGGPVTGAAVVVRGDAPLPEQFTPDEPTPWRGGHT